MAAPVISTREAAIFECLIETVVEPAAPLPPAADTDAVAFLDRWLARSPAPQRFGLRALLHAADVGPLLSGFRHRLRRLAPADRLRYLHRVERVPLAPLRQIVKLAAGMATLAYYGDDHVMRLLGYDADANVARGRALRAGEGRP